MASDLPKKPSSETAPHGPSAEEEGLTARRGPYQANIYVSNTSPSAVDLLKKAAEIEEVVQFAEDGTPPPQSSPLAWINSLRSPIAKEMPQDIAKRWRSLFIEEIGIVKRARNSIVHNVPISPHDTAKAAEVAERLLTAIKSSSTAADQPPY